MGEIAEALRKANEPVDGSDPQTDVKQPLNEETSGEIAAALSRANVATAAPGSVEETDEAEAQEHGPKREPVEQPSVIPDSVGGVIFHVERHRHLGLRVRTELERTHKRSVAVISANRNEGKSIVSCNLAASIASVTNERSVAIVDLDLRIPSIASMLNIPVPVGIEQVLQGRAKLDETRIRLREPEIDVYPCAQPHRAAHELLVLPAFGPFIQELESRYSAVIIDTPPTLLVPDSTLILRHVAYCIAVARVGESRVHRFNEMLDRVPSNKVLGKVLNNVPTPSHTRDDDYYYYSNEEAK